MWYSKVQPFLSGRREPVRESGRILSGVRNIKNVDRIRKNRKNIQ